MLHINFSKNIKSIKGEAQLKVKTTINDNTITAIYGNSGEGKSTLFNILAGLTTPEKGKIQYQDTTWYSREKKINLPTQLRNTGYIFQTNSLFPHFTVKENILYAVQKNKQKEIDLSTLLAQVDMQGMEDRYPSQLSGGQIQRIAIARALAQKAKIILMDEPFSALDLEIKQKLHTLIKNFKEEYHLMILIITHDINDIFYLCDNVLWIKNHEAQHTISTTDFKKEIKTKFNLNDL